MLGTLSENMYWRFIGSLFALDLPCLVSSYSNLGDTSPILAHMLTKNAFNAKASQQHVILLKIQCTFTGLVILCLELVLTQQQLILKRL